MATSSAEPEAQLKDREEQASYRAPRVDFKLSDFNILTRLGDGAFSTVILAEHKQSGKQYAIKIINKHLVMRNKMVEYVKNERNILDKLDYEGLARLKFTFQDPDSLYMGLEYCPGGDLFEQIERKGRLSMDVARFYAAEIVLILEHLRLKQVVHRDLKPENLLLSDSGHLKLTDFGSAKAYFLPQDTKVNSHSRATSFVGTAEYVSPEVLLNKPLSYPADLWALGCIVYQMLAGKPPFKAGSEYLTFQKVTERDFEFPDDFPPVAMDLVNKLLQLEADDRIGASDLGELREHPLFEGTDWAGLRSGPAPDFLRPVRASALEDGLDWELSSLISSTQEGGVVYEHPSS